MTFVFKFSEFICNIVSLKLIASTVRKCFETIIKNVE